MAERAEAARPDMTSEEDAGGESQPRGALSPADFERLTQKVYRLAVAEARISVARGQRGAASVRYRS